MMVSVWACGLSFIASIIDDLIFGRWGVTTHITGAATDIGFANLLYYRLGTIPIDAIAFHKGGEARIVKLPNRKDGYLCLRGTD